jgi:hypothetical protein
MNSILSLPTEIILEQVLSLQEGECVKYINGFNDIVTFTRLAFHYEVGIENFAYSSIWITGIIGDAECELVKEIEYFKSQIISPN